MENVCRFSQTHSYLRFDLLAAGFFSVFLLWKHFKVFLPRRPTDGSSEILQRSQIPLSSSLLSFSFSYLCALLCTIAPQIWLGSSRHLHFYHIYLLQWLVLTSKDLLHLCLSLCPGLAAEVSSNTVFWSNHCFSFHCRTFVDVYFILRIDALRGRNIQTNETARMQHLI